MEVNPGAAQRVLVVAGGDSWTGPLPDIGTEIGEVIAADSGVDLAIELGLAVSVVIGDMDSASPEALAESESQGARIVRYPEDKDATDLELAMDLAVADGAAEIIVLGGVGGRFSHLLGITTLLSGERYAAVRVSWLLPGAAIHVANPAHSVALNGHRSDLVSLIPCTASATGITTQGLRWPLTDDALSMESTRGISNELLADRANVSVTSGTLLVVHERAPR